MNNQQKMCNLTPEEFWDKMMWLIKKYGARFNHSQLAVIEWLKSDTGFDDSKFMLIKRDDELAQEAQAAVNANNGYCPCKFEKTEDNKCPCLDFRSSEEQLVCDCGLYMRVHT